MGAILMAGDGTGIMVLSLLFVVTVVARSISGCQWTLIYKIYLHYGGILLEL